MTKSKMTFVLGLAISMLMSTAVLAAEPATIAGGALAASAPILLRGPSTKDRRAMK